MNQGFHIPASKREWASSGEKEDRVLTKGTVRDPPRFPGTNCSDGDIFQGRELPEGVGEEEKVALIFDHSGLVVYCLDILRIRSLQEVSRPKSSSNRVPGISWCAVAPTPVVQVLVEAAPSELSETRDVVVIKHTMISQRPYRLGYHVVAQKTAQECEILVMGVEYELSECIGRAYCHKRSAY
jgi:hypothetical protein